MVSKLLREDETEEVSSVRILLLGIVSAVVTNWLFFQFGLRQISGHGAIIYVFILGLLLLRALLLPFVHIYLLRYSWYRRHTRLSFFMLAVGGVELLFSFLFNYNFIYAIIDFFSDRNGDLLKISGFNLLGVGAALLLEYLVDKLRNWWIER